MFETRCVIGVFWENTANGEKGKMGILLVFWLKRILV